MFNDKNLPSDDAYPIIYGTCFNMEKETLKLRENNSQLCNFIDKDGYKLWNLLFDNALSHAKEKRKGDGIFSGVNDKYTIPGGG